MGMATNRRRRVEGRKRGASVRPCEVRRLDRLVATDRTLVALAVDRLRAVGVVAVVALDGRLVEWDRDDRVVTTGPRFDEVRPLLEFVAERRDAVTPVKIGAPVRR